MLEFFKLCPVSVWDRAHPWPHLSENLCKPLILYIFLPQTCYLSEILSGFAKKLPPM